ncbi:hypothetical protein ZWY2020_039336 [Hordeum vulgare]|nr:hypothetical protein ZWY2020_039336 [Hordeum vulgare]
MEMELLLHRGQLDLPRRSMDSSRRRLECLPPSPPVGLTRKEMTDWDRHGRGGGVPPASACGSTSAAPSSDTRDATQEVHEDPFEVDRVAATIHHATEQKTAVNCQLASREKATKVWMNPLPLLQRNTQARHFLQSHNYLLKDPEKSDDLIVRRLAAVQGYEMVSIDEKDEPIVLDKDECWVMADNQELKAKDDMKHREEIPA